MHWFKLLICLLFLTQVTACQLTQRGDSTKKTDLEPFPELDNSSFESLPVTPDSELFVLTEKQRTDFIDYYRAIANRDIPKHKRLSNYLSDKLDRFNFLGETFTATQTLNEGSGNCLSLAILTTALADSVGLKTKHQMMNSEPIYHRHSNIMKTSGHVRTFVFSKEKKGRNVRSEAAVIDYFPEIKEVAGEFVSEEDFISMYYQNLAGEAIIAKDYDTAFSYLQEALKQNQYNPYTLNTLAVLHNQVEQHENTKKLYEFAINNTKKTVNLVSNYANYLEAHGQADKAKSLLIEIETTEDSNPYEWLDIANQNLKDGEHELALQYFERALELGPYLHEVHFGLAQLYWQQGNTDKAIESLEKAKELTPEYPQKRLYIAKAMTLRKSVD